MANGYELVTEAHTDPRTGVTKFVIYETSGHPKFWGFGRTYEEAEKAARREMERWEQDMGKAE